MKREIEEEKMLQYCRDRLKVYILLRPRRTHEKSCRILSLYN